MARMDLAQDGLTAAVFLVLMLAGAGAAAWVFRDDVSLLVDAMERRRAPADAAVPEPRRTRGASSSLKLKVPEPQQSARTLENP